MTPSWTWSKLGSVCLLMVLQQALWGCSTISDEEAASPAGGSKAGAEVPAECGPWCKTGCWENCDGHCTEMMAGSDELSCDAEVKAAMECQSAKNTDEECGAMQTRCEAPMKAWWNCVSTACKTNKISYCEKVH